MNRTLVLAVLVASTACTAYAPITPRQAAGTDQVVRVVLTDQGSVALAPLLGGAATELVGRVSDATDSTLTLGVSELTRLNGADESWKGERVSIPLRDVGDVSRRTISAPRSAVLAALLAGGTYLAGRSFGRGNVSGTHDTYGGGKQ